MLFEYARAQYPDPRFRNASTEEFNNAVADYSEIRKWLGKNIKYREFIHLKAVFISNMLRKLAICLATIFVFVLHSNTYGRLGFYMYHHGYTIMYRDSESKYFGLFYEKAPNDSITISNRALLGRKKELHLGNNAPILAVSGNQQFVPEDFDVYRRFKLVSSDSVFLSLYHPRWILCLHYWQYVLNDLKGGGQYYLNDFSMHDFNSLLDQNISIQSQDYISLARLYIILSDVQSGYDFIESNDDMISAIDEDFLGITKKQRKALYQLTENAISRASIDSTGNYIAVTLNAYHPPLEGLSEEKIYFQGKKIIQHYSRIVITSSQIENIILHK